MKKFFKKTIKEHIKILGHERKELIRTLWVCPKGTLRYAVFNLSLKHLEFKIAVWKTLV